MDLVAEHDERAQVPRGVAGGHPDGGEHVRRTVRAGQRREIVPPRANNATLIWIPVQHGYAQARTVAIVEASRYGGEASGQQAGTSAARTGALLTPE
jgi:hypothetical protein